eukprot:CAMPEP_0198266558 /NCGR_PEP_ID=MMETSP1447-20131203/28876_1 /TAXON_ID=420782 /ORGANISM="Chaetoceros dichaeta, Strain CCMP1751" /LENGTH=104 /DNA_ID=CAMNT_0043956695 /DNA_START=228 /DNA_END=539 /DNA_ORIENTATION=+
MNLIDNAILSPAAFIPMISATYRCEIKSGSSFVVDVNSMTSPSINDASGSITKVPKPPSFISKSKIDDIITGIRLSSVILAFDFASTSISQNRSSMPEVGPMAT